MYVREIFTRLLIAVALISVIQDTVDATKRSVVNRPQSKKTEKSPGPMEPGDSPASTSDNPSTEEEEEENFFPFIKTTSLSPDDVVGVILKPNKTVLLGREVYKIEPREKDFDFQNFFKQFKNLLVVEVNGITLEITFLEDLQKFMPTMLKGFAVRSCHIPENAYELIAEMLKKRPSIISVSIVDAYASGEESEKVLASLGDLTKAEYLNLVFGEITKEGVENIIGLMNKSASTLREFALGAISAALEEIYSTIGKLTALTKFEIALIEIKTDDVASLGAALSNLKKLEQLQIFLFGLSEQDNVKRFEACEKLSDSISKLKNLKHVDISSNKFPDDVMQLVMQALQSTPDLKSLNISGNKLTAKSAGLLAAVLPEAHNLKTLVANDCGIDNKIFGVISEALVQSPVEQLFFKNNLIGEAVANWNVSQMPNLSLIDLANNGIDFQPFFTFYKSACKATKLAVANFTGNNLNVAAQTDRNNLEVWRAQNAKGSNIIILGM
jgi:hypothetical protein